MGRERIVVAIGGNSLIADPKRQSVEDQFVAARETDHHLGGLVAAGYDLTVVHGNGPQVGFILLRSELARGVLHEVPLDVCVADTQGAIGYALQQQLLVDLRGRGIDRSVVSVVTQVEVDPDDPAFSHPTKPIGSFLDAEEARRRPTRTAGTSRRTPTAAGGGSSPRRGRSGSSSSTRSGPWWTPGSSSCAPAGAASRSSPTTSRACAGSPAVIDKDHAASLLATELGATRLAISTAIEQVWLDFGTDRARPVDHLTPRPGPRGARRRDPLRRRQHGTQDRGGRRVPRGRRPPGGHHHPRSARRRARGHGRHDHRTLTPRRSAMAVPGIETYHRPPDVDEAWRLVRDGGASVRLLAGGSDLTVRAPATVTTLVDLQAAGLRWVDADDDGALHVGAMTTFTDLLHHPAAQAYARGVLVDVLQGFGSVLHRNLGTIGGHLARARLSDVVPSLLALDATVDVRSDEVVTLPLADYLDGPRSAGTPHLLTAVHLPPDRPGSAGAFERLTRTEFDHAMVNACAWVATEDGTVTDARVAAGLAGRLGRRLADAEAALVGGPLDQDRITACAEVVRDALPPAGGPDGDTYRRHVAGVLVGRCLTTVRDRIEGGPR
jgi:carbamate kinase